ncbi:MAG: 4Fe-4S dicluster domain-containing protein [Planctomycetota bacterium]|jgi:ferredoxin
MEAVFISKLKPFLDAVAGEMELYVPRKRQQYYFYGRYNPNEDKAVELNNVRTCSTVKEFLFPTCELAAVYPKPTQPEEIKPFAVFGLKNCDLCSLEILDNVFAEPELEDASYVKRRENMLIISSDCNEPGESCFCNLFDGKPFSQRGYDLNVSEVKGGFLIEASSQKGQEFISRHSELFSEADEALLAERAKNRDRAQIVESAQDSEAFDLEAKDCVECQACTRICPTCHCFYLYDTSRADYFAKMKMWDSCVRMAYAAVAGGENPRKIIGDRIRHRIMHKFVYFPGEVLKKLNEEFKDKSKGRASVRK